MWGIVLALLLAVALVIWDPLKLFRQPRTVVGKAIAWVRARLVDDARNVLRWWSTRFNIVGAAILSWVQFDPVHTLGVWNMMPPEVRRILPPSTLAIVGFVLLGLGMLSRLVKQPKLHA